MEDRFDPDLVESRMNLMKEYLECILQVESVCASQAIRRFLDYEQRRAIIDQMEWQFE